MLDLINSYNGEAYSLIFILAEIFIFYIIFGVIAFYIFGKKQFKTEKEEKVFLTFQSIFILFFVFLFVEKFDLLPLAEPRNVQIFAFPNPNRDKNYYIEATIGNNKVNEIYFSNGGGISFESCNGFNNKGKMFTCTPEIGAIDWGFILFE